MPDSNGRNRFIKGFKSIFGLRADIFTFETPKHAYSWRSEMSGISHSPCMTFSEIRYLVLTARAAYVYRRGWQKVVEKGDDISSRQSDPSSRIEPVRTSFRYGRLNGTRLRKVLGPTYGLRSCQKRILTEGIGFLEEEPECRLYGDSKEIANHLVYGCSRRVEFELFGSIYRDASLSHERAELTHNLREPMKETGLWPSRVYDRLGLPLLLAIHIHHPPISKV